jgi:DNA helicase-2/ATP-dependent DNA helicase PcrA
VKNYGIVTLNNMQLFLSDPLLEGLNDEQQRAVTEIDGPVQVVASAGSGKTTVLTRRIAYMLNQGISPSSILAVTFTKKASNEMLSRLKKLVTSKKAVESILIGTYHSVFLSILDGNYGALGFTSDQKPNLCMDSRQKTIIKTILSELNASFNADEALTILGQIKNMGIYPEELQDYISRGVNPLPGINPEDLTELLNIYNYYQNYLRDSNLIDFDDILMLTRKLLQTNEPVRTKLQAQYKYLLVDEFQDVNQVQYDITKILAAPQNNLFVVGDDAQSIYQFRGSDVSIILNFSKDYPNTNMIKLESNYRCTPEIIDLSNKLIKFNTDQIPKVVKASRPSIKDSVNFYLAPDVTEESFFVAKQIKGLVIQRY